MVDVAKVIQLVQDQNSADNNVRRRGELQYNQLVGHHLSDVAYALIQIIMDHHQPVDIKQSSLLHLRRLVPKHWSLGFESFTGDALDQSLKQMIRQSLITLVTSTDDSKIRNGASYVIVQIAVADYPDEWPDLLQVLYHHTKDYGHNNAMKGGLKVLNDLFDDLVTEEQFWDGCIGSQIINHLIDILSQPSLSSDVKLSAIQLYKNVLNILQSPEAFNESTRKLAVYDHVKISGALFNQLLSQSINNSLTNAKLDFIEVEYRTSIYSVISILIGSFNKIIPPDTKASIFSNLLDDFNYLLPIYLNIGNHADDVPSIIASSNDDPYRDISSILNELLSVLGLLQHSIKIGQHCNDANYETFVNKLVSVSTLTFELIENYESDINEFINDVTGLSGFVNVRDTINEFLSELNSSDSQSFFTILSMNIINKNFTQWNYGESCLYLLESLCQNEDCELDLSNINLLQLLESITSLIRFDNDVNHHPLLASRVLLLLPKFFEKFESDLGKDILVKTFLMVIDFVGQIPFENSDFNFIKASSLISCANYFNLLDIGELITDYDKKHSTQTSIFNLIFSLLEESEEDALVVLLEALTASINMDAAFAANCLIVNSISVIDLVLKISFKNPGNVQITVESSNCLTTLLKNLSISEYISCCEKSLPIIFNIINESFVNNIVEYSPKLDLSLDLLNIILESVPPSSAGNEKILPIEVFNYTFPTVKKLLLFATDDQLLQSGGAVFNSLLQYGTNSFETYKDSTTGEAGMESLLNIVSKFLSPQLSDRAALNCGNIVTSLINKFQQQLGDEFLSQILKATAERLIIAKEIITIENLIMLFCNLVLLSPESMIDFLSSNVTLKDPKTGELKPGLSLILPIWFQSFEVTRGYEKIKQNALALAKIYSLGDKRIENLIVNGDIIPYDGDRILTRSMTKSMPEKYTQISASLKIIKLLIGELDFQCQQPNAGDYLPQNSKIEGEDNDQITNEVDEDDDDGDWEDLEDIGVPNYEKLKSYVDSDDEDNHEESNDDGLKNLLIQFFKECVSKNIGNFEQYYTQISDEEKKIITENVFF